jgi:GMP synthase (glutamine-hydrolysing)
MHYFEFIKPIEDIVKNKYEFKTTYYESVSKEDLDKVDKIIISGTSLMDFDFLKNLEKFQWLKSSYFNVPVLAICGGMQILAVLFNNKLIKSKEIGLTEIEFKKPFLGLQKKIRVYELHQKNIKTSNNFIVYAQSKKGIQAIKHKEKPFYGVMFHPEVLQKEMILEFLKI